MSYFRYSCLVSLVLLFAGCGPNVKLGGRVTFPDGEPLTAGTIIFSNADFLARANLKADGTYDVGSLSQKDGLPPGKYRVYIIGTEKVVGKRPFVRYNESGTKINDEEDILEPQIPLKYAHRDTTPLEIEVPGQNVYNITVERP